MKYNKSKISSAVRKLASETLSNSVLSKNIIIQVGESYRVFGRYFIVPKGSIWVVKSDNVGDSPEFSTAQIALSWCVLDNVGKYEAATNILRLDARIAQKQNDIDAAMARLKKNLVDAADKPILQSRIVEDIDKKRMYKEQLLKNLKVAKYIKLKEFQT